jgi:hypothetical protein
MGFEFDREAVDRTGDLYEGFLSPIAIPDSFLDVIRERFYEPTGGMKSESFRPYVEAYIDFYRLLEEIRFELALATLLIDDYERKASRGDAPARHAPELPLPAESKALLLRFLREPPNPERLFSDPYSTIAGHRLLSDWFAGQTLDSALVRAVAACDRLATLLWTRVEQAVPASKQTGRPRHPAFRHHELSTLAQHYDASPAWPEILGLSQHELFAFTKDLRDDFTHAHRLASQLHGDQYVVFAEDGEAIEGADADDHLSIGIGFYNEILRPAVRLVGELLATKTKPVPPGGAEKFQKAKELYDSTVAATENRQESEEPG